MFLSILFSLLTFGNPVSEKAESWPPKKSKTEAARRLPPGEVGMDDISRADSDGPHVFYRGGKVLVKAVERRDSVAAPTETVFASREAIRVLSCTVPETGDRFFFRLRKELPVQAHEYDLPAKMLVISDIEGNFKGFKMLLQGAKVVDENLNWSFGNGHLVMVGDFFDRGLNVTEVLWLIYKLETEAEAAGGKVHFILGNHEVLNLEGNTQYVRNKYLENADLLREPYEKWYSPDSELGRWLRTKNVMEKIGDNVFCHGGISEEMYTSGLTIKEVNEAARRGLGIPFDQISNPLSRQVLDPKTGIIWFRGMAKKMVSNEHVTAALQWAGAKRLIIGHTLMSDVTASYNGRVFCIDLYHDENLRQGFMKTLWIEGGSFYSIDHKGEKSSVFSVVFSKN